MRKSIVSLSLLFALGLGAVPAFSQQNHGAHHAGEAAQARYMTDAEVRKIDKAARKITLRHGEIKNLEMPPMTMVFQVKDPALLDAVQAGDKVRFRAEKVAGALVVTALEGVK